MTVTVVQPTAALDDVVEIIERDGGVVIENFLTPEVLAGLNEDLSPVLDATSFGPGGFAGNKTKRVAALYKHSMHLTYITVHPLYLGAAERILQKPSSLWYGDDEAAEVPTIQVGATNCIEIHPGQTGQVLHRDDAIWQWRHTEGGSREARLQIMVALTDFTAENGATLVIPESNKWDDNRQPELGEASPVEMKAGSALLWTGSTYHAGGANVSDAPRRGLSIGLDLGYLRQEENLYLALPLDVVKKYPVRVRQLLGYQACPPLMGWIEIDGVMSDPSAVLEDTLVATQAGGFGNTTGPATP
ncbi:phytanoyl-CoA dioxygenase family protein [Rhodococcus sp. JVH1]|uniref:phytanoyl-CoA dioxygenase family protein n=1 Tax=Rhodococcus sp. JVH1 TaxID=745408 RepID=UPI0002721839|nr:phytanoyl-CoA dioxygenase family protein [Rhodococcus sp. JVH1]EJI95810.1 phytanoyl-CoA dioxygenase family protein [Rhodococcus sp. JVH1]